MVAGVQPGCVVVIEMKPCYGMVIRVQPGHGVKRLRWPVTSH